MRKEISLVMLCLFLISCQERQDQTKEISPIVQEDTEAFDYSTCIGKDYFLDDQHSYVGFKIKYFGYSPVRGRFDDFDGTMFYDPTHPEALSVSVFVDVASVNTGESNRDNDLLKEGSWFDADNHPYMSFQSSSCSVQEGGSLLVTGMCTIKGVGKEVVIEFDPPTAISRDWAGNEQVDFSGKMVLNRQDFGVFGGDFWSSVMENGLTQLSDEVEIELDIHARRADYEQRFADSDSTSLSRRILELNSQKGIKPALEYADSLLAIDELSAGKLSTVAYTLNSRGLYKEAEEFIERRIEYYPLKSSSFNQMGITQLHLSDYSSAREAFSIVDDREKTDSRAVEYLRLMDKLEDSFSD